MTRSAGSAKNFGHQLAAVLEIAERWGPVDVSHRKPLTAVPTRVSCASPRRRSGVLSSLTAWSCPTHRFAREKWVKAIVEWIETFFGHIKHEWPHLNDIGDPVELERELARLRIEYNTVRLHEAIGYVTPDDEHHGRGEPIREARRQGLQRARQQRLDHNRRHTTNHTEETP